MKREQCIEIIKKVILKAKELGNKLDKNAMTLQFMSTFGYSKRTTQEFINVALYELRLDYNLNETRKEEIQATLD